MEFRRVLFRSHIKQIVSTQQNYAKVSGLVENVRLADMMEDALRIVESGLVRHKIRVERDWEPVPVIAADKHQIIQILLNLLRNAKQAMHEGDGDQGEKVIRLDRKS